MKNFKRITKRGLSLFIALVMCMSVMSLTAFAEDDVTGEPEIVAEQVTEPAGVETQDPIEVVEPVEDEEPAEEPAPVEDEAPVEEPAETEEPVEDAEPVEDEAPAETEEPAEAEEPVEEEEPVAEAAAATITGAAIVGADNFENDGNFVMIMDGSKPVTEAVLTLTTDVEATFVVTEYPQMGELYVSGVSEDGYTVTLNFNFSDGGTDLNAPEYALTLTSTDKTTWSGSFGNGFQGETLADFGALLQNQVIYMAAGAMAGPSAARRLLVNVDDTHTMLILCKPDAVVSTVDYAVENGATISWKLVDGMSVIKPELSGVKGWYTDAGYTTELASGATVNGNMTIYGKTDTTPVNPDQEMIDALKAGGLVEIGDLTTWNAFAANAEYAVAATLVRLTDDINCGGASYPSMNFKGNFDGNGKTISYATFTTVDGYYNNSTETNITCCAMFNVIGGTQVIANLTLDHITAKDSGATYAAPLAGIVDGAWGPNATIQNVQVTNCDVYGRTAGGVVGYTRQAYVRFCSSKNTTVKGVTNAGGIVGINTSETENCFSTCTSKQISVLNFFSGKTGGIAAKNLRAGKITFCWSILSQIAGENSGLSVADCLPGVSAETTPNEFEKLGFSETYWLFENGTATDFDFDEISYDFQQ